MQGSRSTELSLRGFVGCGDLARSNDQGEMVERAREVAGLPPAPDGVLLGEQVEIMCEAGEPLEHAASISTRASADKGACTISSRKSARVSASAIPPA